MLVQGADGRAFSSSSFWASLNALLCMLEVELAGLVAHGRPLAYVRSLDACLCMAYGIGANSQSAGLVCVLKEWSYGYGPPASGDGQVDWSDFAVSCQSTLLGEKVIHLVLCQGPFCSLYLWTGWTFAAVPPEGREDESTLCRELISKVSCCILMGHCTSEPAIGLCTHAALLVSHLVSNRVGWKVRHDSKTSLP